jgi:hypothetical protein
MSDKLPAGAARLMIAMLVVFALVAIYANVQRARRDKIDTVKITFASPSPTPSPVR